MFGARLIAELQDKWAARLYFNTLIPFEDGLIKYGVISRFIDFTSFCYECCCNNYPPSFLLNRFSICQY